jgi:hypothetical protein
MSGEGTPEVDEHPRVTEPNEQDDETEAAEAPAVATATNDPNRYTIYVPTDHTTLSLGQAGSWIPDQGITGKTDNHFHMFVVGTTAPTDNTIMTLGAPATAHSIDAHVGNLTQAIHGYSLVTSGNAWHDSKLQQVVMSREADLTLCSTGEGKAVGIQADAGKVLVFGKETVTLGSPQGIKIGAHPDTTPENIGYEGSWSSNLADNLGAKAGSSITTLGEIATSAIALYAGFAPSAKLGKEGEAGWKDSPLPSAGKVLVDLKLFQSTVVRGAMEIAGCEPKGSVSVSGQKFVSVTAGIGATMYGSVASSVVSLAQAQLLGGASAVVKGLLWTEIASGLLTALTSIKNIEIAASKGEIGMTAKTEVYISSQTDAVIITGKTASQMTSDGEVFMHGGKAAYLGAGPDGGFGFGVEIKAAELVLGKASSPDKFKSPGFVADNQIAIKDGGIELKVGKTEVALAKDALEMKASKIELKVSGVGMEITSSGKILVG